MRVQDTETADGAHPVVASGEQQSALHLWVVMSRAHAAIALHAAADVAQHGLTLAEFAILEVLYHRGAMLLGEVQRRILVSSGGITFLVDRLTVKGLVERRSCPSDRRARYAALTPQGESLMAEIFPEHAATIARAMGALPPHDLQRTAESLRTLGLYASALPEKRSASQQRDDGGSE